MLLQADTNHIPSFVDHLHNPLCACLLIIHTHVLHCPACNNGEIVIRVCSDWSSSCSVPPCRHPFWTSSHGALHCIHPFCSMCLTFQPQTRRERYIRDSVLPRSRAFYNSSHSLLHRFTQTHQQRTSYPTQQPCPRIPRIPRIPRVSKTTPKVTRQYPHDYQAFGADISTQIAAVAED